MAKTKKQLRAEAVERLKNCAAARFDAESIVIVLTSGRHGQSDWSLECDKLIYLLTDDANDDSAPEKVVSSSELFLTPLSSTNGTGNGEDSREELETDMREWWRVGLPGIQEKAENVINYNEAIKWLDRQAAITQHEITERWAEHLHPIERKCGDLRRKVEELTAERDNLKANNEQLHTLVGEQAVKIDELQAQVDKLTAERQKPNPDCSAMLYKKFTENMKHVPCSDYEPKDGVVAILREAASNLSDYHDAGEALRRLTDTWNVYHALETLADMVERDYVRRESVEEIMDNDRALVEENSMLAREGLKLRAELEKATNNLNSANEDFENAMAELAAERDNLKDELIDERGELNRQINTMRDVIRDLRNERDHYRSKFGKCIDYADAIHALMDDEGLA